MAKYVAAPVPIMQVLDAALKALDADGRFRSVANGHMEVSWRQASAGRNGEGARPERYALIIECGFVPESASVSERAAQSAALPKGSGGASVGDTKP